MHFDVQSSDICPRQIRHTHPTFPHALPSAGTRPGREHGAVKNCKGARMKSLNICFRMSMFVVSLGLCAAATPSCGEEGDGKGGAGNGDDTKQGYTECNGSTCQPGQYCWGSGICENGCLSSENCAADQQCNDEGEGWDGAGVCVDGDGPAGEGEGEEGEGEGPDESDCDGYADHAQSCGLRASEAEAIRQFCDQLTAAEQEAMVACDAAESCDEFRACSGVECFSDDDCAGGETCRMQEDVEDPFTQQPYQCD
jgi:hypothetical protein